MATLLFVNFILVPQIKLKVGVNDTPSCKINDIYFQTTVALISNYFPLKYIIRLPHGNIEMAITSNLGDPI